MRLDLLSTQSNPLLALQQEPLFVDPRALIVRVRKDRVLDQAELLRQDLGADLLGRVQRLDQLAPVVPRAVVGEVRADLLIRKVELGRFAQLAVLDHEESMLPAVKVTLVRVQECAAQAQLVRPAQRRMFFPEACLVRF